MTEIDPDIQLAKDYKSTFETPHGERVFEDLKKRGHYDLSIEPVDNNNRIDLSMVMKNEGKRSIIVHILRKLKRDVEKPRQKEAN